MDESFERGTSGAHRFTRLQAAQEIIESGSEQSPHELADREMSKWMKVWTVHDDSEVSLPPDCEEWDMLPYITTQMVRDAILTFKWKTAAGPSKLQPRSLWFLSSQALDILAACFMRCEQLFSWPARRIHAELARIPKDGGGTRLVALIHTLLRVWGEDKAPPVQRMAEAFPL